MSGLPSSSAFKTAVTATLSVRNGARARVVPVGEGHGWRLGRIVDPFGHHWEIGRPSPDMP